MKKIFFTLTAFVLLNFVSSCTNDEYSSTYSEKEQDKIESLVNLFDSYGWELDSGVSIEQRNKELLKMDYEETKNFLEYMSKGIEFDNFDPVPQSEDNDSEASKDKKTSRTYMTYPIYGSHSAAVASSQTTMILAYNGPNPSSITIERTEVSSNPASTWIPDEYGSFSFSGNRCDNIRATGTIKYGSFYSHKYEMIGWCSKNSSGIVNDGKVTNFHEIN